MTNLEHALACAQRGWLVFPSEAKHPKVRWSVASTTDPATITDWWTRWPDADVCIKTGEASNLVVVDWDRYKHQFQTLAQHPLGDLMPRTYTVETTRGGEHAYFTHPGFPVANSAGTLAQYVDVRGDGGMVVAYRKVLDQAPLVPIPESLCTRRTSASADPTVSLTPARKYDPSNAHAWARNIYQAALANIRFAKEGTRNLTLYTQASDVYRLVWDGALDQDAVTQELGDLALSIGLDPHEIAASLASAMRNAATQYAQKESE